MKTKRKPRPKKTKEAVPDLAAILKEVMDSGLSLRNDCQRVMGTVAGDNHGDDAEKRWHRLRSITGRLKFTIKTSTRYVRAIHSLRNFLDCV